MTNIQYGMVGLGIGLVLSLIILIWQSSIRKDQSRLHNAEIDRLKKILSDRMDIESEGIQKIRLENEDLRKKNENLRVTNSTLMQKPGKQEVHRLTVYQKAIDHLIINAPGFAQAWQTALKDAEGEYSDVYNGNIPFWKRVLPVKSSKMIKEDNSVENSSEKVDNN